MKPTRREILGTAAGVTAAGAGIALSARLQPQKAPAPRHWPVSPVSIVKAPAYDMRVYDAVYRLVAEHNPDVRGKRIVLKPNLVEFDATHGDQHPSDGRACGL